MKKQILFPTLLALTIMAPAQVPFSLTDGECAVVYSLPKAELCVEVQTEKVTQKPGMFYRYSERYLAATRVITSEKTTYRLKSVAVKTHAIPDPARTYKFVKSKNTETVNISENSQGLLCGVNVPVKQDLKLTPVVTIPSTDQSQNEVLLPLGEEYMMAGSEAKLAEGAAKQIYRIRESRVGLLTADVEKLPADGASLNSMLEGLNKMECELTELFVGKIITETQTQTLIIPLDSALNSHVLFRMSALRGLVPADDLSGTPYYINITPALIHTVVAGSKTKKEVPGLYSVLPASTQVVISDGINNYFSGQFFIPQFGKVIPISENVIQQKKVKIYIDPETGRLLQIK
jgi:hypothetical protein